MNRGLLTLLLALGLGLAAFQLTRTLVVENGPRQGGPHEESSRLPELEWLRREFALSDAEFEKVSALHRDYRPTCEKLCARVADARDRVRQLVLAGGPVTPEIEAAFREEGALRAECQSAMLGHLHQTASLLPPDKARAYLEAMLPELLGATGASEPASHRH